MLNVRYRVVCDTVTGFSVVYERNVKMRGVRGSPVNAVINVRAMKGSVIFKC